MNSDADAAGRYFAEMAQVRDRYRTHLAATYAGPLRHADRQFWARRRGVMSRQWLPFPAAVAT